MRLREFKKINPLLRSSRVFNYIDTELKAFGKLIYLKDLINFNRFGIGYTNTDKIIPLVEDIFISQLLFSKSGSKITFLRNHAYYNCSNKPENVLELQKQLLVHISTYSRKLDKVQTAVLRFCLIDNLRNTILNIISSKDSDQFAKKDSDFKNVLDEFLFIYFNFIINGIWNKKGLLRILRFVTTLEFSKKTAKEWVKIKDGPRELDNPIEIIAFGIQIIKSLHKFDLIVDFPSGSATLASSINAISKVLTGKALSNETIEINTSLYRMKKIKQQNYLKATLSNLAKKKEIRKILLVDDNLFSGATLIYFKSFFRVLFPQSLIKCAVVNIYLKGLKDWEKGKYQYIRKKDLKVFPDLSGDLSRKFPRIFTRTNPLLEKINVKPIDNKLKRIIEQIYIWGAELKPNDFIFFDTKTSDGLKKLYGFHSYSLVFEGYFDLLSYRPISEVTFDEFVINQI